MAEIDRTKRISENLFDFNSYDAPAALISVWLSNWSVKVICDVFGNIIIPIIFCLIIRKIKWFGGEAAEWLPITKKKVPSARIGVIISAVAGYALYIALIVIILNINLYYFSFMWNVAAIELIDNALIAFSSICLYRIFLSAPIETAVSNKITAEN